MTREMSLARDIYIENFYSSLDCPRSLTCWLLYKSGQHDELANINFDPYSYNDSKSAFDSLTASKFMSKATFLKTSYVLKDVARRKFEDAEDACKVTNRNIWDHRFKNPMTESILSMATRKIQVILGSFSADEFVDSCNWGPGATTSIRRSNATAPLKFECETRISKKAYDFVLPFFHSAYPSWDVKFEINGCAKIVTVPKDAKSDRTIAIEPGLNLWFQKGIGTMIRRRLNRVGIDLNDQRRNQELARIGSKFNNLATIDFSSASDTISKQLVRELFSDKWLTLLDTFRSCLGNFNGDTFHYEKFSSMGNGYTFELESLVFYTLAVCSCELLGVDTTDISVYGDDVILPIEATDTFSSICADLGFTVNKSKSYSSSYYRESCGEHFWNGRRIKPIFQKEDLNGKTALLKAANNVRRLSHRHGITGCDNRFRNCWLHLCRSIGTHVPLISDGYGDLGLVVNIDEAQGTFMPAKHGYEGYTVRVWAPLAQQIEQNGEGLRLTKLRSALDFRERFITDPSDLAVGGNFVPLPGRVRHAKVRVLIHRWLDDGGWLPS